MIRRSPRGEVLYLLILVLITWSCLRDVNISPPTLSEEVIVFYLYYNINIFTDEEANSYCRENEQFTLSFMNCI